MIYRYFWLIGQIVFQAFIRRLFYVGAERIPNKPLFLAVNHPNSFFDGVVINTFVWRGIYSLARGDVFRNPYARWWMRQFKMEPIFRAQDVEVAGENVKKNEETLEACERILAKNGAINIFIEGLSVQEKRLRPLRKGLARMALQAENETGWTSDIHVMPVGVNYTIFGSYDMEVMVEFGEALPVSPYREAYAQNPNRAVKQLQDKIEQGLKPLVIHVDTPEMDAAVEPFLEIARHRLNLPRLPWKTGNPIRFKTEKAVADWANALAKDQPATWQSLADQSLAYQAGLDKADTTELALATRAKSWPVDLLIAVLLAVPALVGAVIHAVPYLTIRTFANKLFKGTVFYDSVNVGGAMALQGIWLLVVVGTCLAFSWKLALAAVFVVPVSLLGFRAAYLAIRRLRSAVRYFALPETERNALQNLRSTLLAALPA